MSDNNNTLHAVPLTAKDYLPFGNVIESAAGSISANQGTAQRTNWLASLENLRGENARANVCVFRCQPRKLPFEIKLLEHHPKSTQMFVPMNAEKRYLVVVALGDREYSPNSRPDVSTIKAFIATNRQGITYYPGIWHHPLIALDKETDFHCVIWEDGSPQDCTVVNLDQTILCHVEDNSPAPSRL